jgi:hypothetical protein
MSRIVAPRTDVLHVIDRDLEQVDCGSCADGCTEEFSEL